MSRRSPSINSLHSTRQSHQVATISQVSANTNHRYLKQNSCQKAQKPSSHPDLQYPLRRATQSELSADRVETGTQARHISYLLRPQLEPVLTSSRKHTSSETSMVSNSSDATTALARQLQVSHRLLCAPQPCHQVAHLSVAPARDYAESPSKQCCLTAPQAQAPQTALRDPCDRLKPKYL